MNFDFISEESPDLHHVRLMAVTLRERYNSVEPERKRLMKESRESGDTDTHKLMTSSRPPAWFAIVSCDECPQDSLVSSNVSATTRFACSACHQPASLSWVEEDSRQKVELMYEGYIDKQAGKAKKADSGWDQLAKKNHAASVKKYGCKVGTTCEWCREGENT